MQPILLVAIVGVAAVALGTGFLNNDIELWIQQFGVGSGDISSPTDHAYVDFTIEQKPNPNINFPNTFVNVIDTCIVTPQDNVGDPDSTVKPSEITCKLTDINGNIIAEGTVSGNFFLGGVPVTVPITIDPLNIVTLVQNVHDVIVVIHADTYSVGDTDLPPPGPPAP